MKTIIAGSRSIKNLNHLAWAIGRSRFEISEVVSGGARGIDQLGEQWAILNSVPVKQFIPNWERFGKAAGMIRNAEMARYADALIAVWDGKSRGTQNMIEQAKKYGLRLYVATGLKGNEMNERETFAQIKAEEDYWLTQEADPRTAFQAGWEAGQEYARREESNVQNQATETSERAELAAVSG